MSYIAFRGAVFVIYGSFFYFGIKKTTLRAVVLFFVRTTHILPWLEAVPYLFYVFLYFLDWLTVEEVYCCSAFGCIAQRGVAMK